VYCALGLEDRTPHEITQHHVRSIIPYELNIPFIVFPTFNTEAHPVVETLLWNNADTSDFALSAYVIPEGFSTVVCCSGTIFSKDMDGANYGRVETHSDGYVSVFGFGIGGTPAPGCFSPDGNSWCSDMVSSRALTIGVPTVVTFTRIGQQLSLYFGLDLVASATQTPTNLTSSINWRIGSRMINLANTGQAGHNVFDGTIAGAMLYPGTLGN